MSEMMDEDRREQDGGMVGEKEKTPVNTFSVTCDDVQLQLTDRSSLY